MAEDIIVSGKADFVGMARPSLSDPYIPNKAMNGQVQDIRQCIACLQGCTASTYMGVPIHCLVNPELGYEFETDYSKTSIPKKVFIAGGGVAGMEAARAAAIKGHKVHLYEATDSLGGQFVVLHPIRRTKESSPACLHGSSGSLRNSMLTFNLVLRSLRRL